MYIIIIGCGKVGLSLAEQLSDENHDITLVDSSADKLQNLSDDLDVMKILGNGASISTLQDAGIERADILIAVTGSDELNLLCCLIAKKAGHASTIARVRNPIYNNEIDFIRESIGLSHDYQSRNWQQPLRFPGSFVFPRRLRSIRLQKAGRNF